MSVQFCLALLALSSLTAASDPDCETLLQPLEDRSKVVGKWILYAGTVEPEEHLKNFKTLNSSWIDISLIPDSDDITLRWGDKSNDGKCVYGAINSSISENTTKVTFYFNSTTHVHVGKHLKSCPDCILWIDTSLTETANKEIIKGRNLYFFTKSGTLDASDLEVLKKQAECLNFPTDFHFGETTDLCPDATDAKEEEQ